MVQIISDLTFHSSQILFLRSGWRRWWRPDWYWTRPCSEPAREGQPSCTTSPSLALSLMLQIFHIERSIQWRFKGHHHHPRGAQDCRMAVQVEILHEFKPFLEQDASSSKDQVSLNMSPSKEWSDFGQILVIWRISWSTCTYVAHANLGTCILECGCRPFDWGSSGTVCARQPCCVAGGP